MAMPESILSVENLTKCFPTKQGLVRAIDGISFVMAPGDTLGLVGESGSGKTTTAQCIVGMYPPTSGDILFKGETIGAAFNRRPKHVKGDLRIVFQPLSDSGSFKILVIVGAPWRGVGDMQDNFLLSGNNLFL